MRRQGYATIADPDGRLVEADSMTCGHCQRIVLLHDRKGSARPSVAVRCTQCDRGICVPCAEVARCDPFEEKLLRMEAGFNYITAAR